MEYVKKEKNVTEWIKEKDEGKKIKYKKNKNLINKTKPIKNVMPLKKPSFVLFICTCIKSALFLL